MASIYLQTVITSDEIYNTVKSELSKGLESQGHHVTTIDYFEDYESEYSNALVESDVIIAAISSDALGSSTFKNEILKNNNYAERVKKPFFKLLFTDVLLDDIENSSTNPEYNVILKSASLPDIRLASDALNQKIQEYLGVKIATNEAALKAKKLIDASAETFVSKTKQDLKTREHSLRNTAYVCYGLGLIAIVAGIFLVFIFAANGLKVHNQDSIIAKFKPTFKKEQVDSLINEISEKQINWSLTVYFGIKSILILTLLIAASKYCFNLAKAFMVESLKIADRSHAISFGQFYLEVFNKGIEPSELRDVFSDWNISTQNTAFNVQKTDDFDPKYLERAIDIINKAKEVIKKE